MRKHTVYAAAAMLLLNLVAGCATNPVTGKRELELITRDQEIALGEQAAPEFEKEFGGRLPDAEVQKYVLGVGRKLAGVSDRVMPYEYTVVNSDVPNAFALPGGKIFITKGLLKLMSNERQLAAVLGHETGHVAAKHNVSQLNRQMGAAILLDIAKRASGSKESSAPAVTQFISNMVLLKYSRDNEYQADELGAKYMQAAGYNPWGMVELLTALQEMHEAEPSRLEEMFQTHPLTSKRIEETRTIVQTQHKSARPNAPDPGIDRFRKIQARLK